MRLVPVFALTLAPLLAALSPLAGQAEGAAAHIALGDSATAALRPEEALAHYRAAVAVDSTHAEALWKSARAIADIAKQIEGDADMLRERRDSLYTVGRASAEAALRAAPEDADAHYVLAMVLGRLSRTKGSKERVRFAKVIFDAASRAVAIDSTHDGAHHVLGAWHAEVKRLSGVQRFFAKNLFGGGVMDRASWEWAIWHLKMAVAHAPQHIYHRLELAEVLVDREQYAEARQHLEAIPMFPVADVLDERYKNDAAVLLERIQGKRDKA